MFGVDERVLVPRPETELAIEWAVRHLRAIGRENGSAADVGTGSGAIAVTLASELPELSVYASDVSQDALAVARRNAARNDVFQHVTFLHGDLAAPLLPYAPFDCVVANLPYVPDRRVRRRAGSGVVRAAARARRRPRRAVALPPARAGSARARRAARDRRARSGARERARARTRSCARRCRTRASRRSATTPTSTASSSRSSRRTRGLAGELLVLARRHADHSRREIANQDWAELVLAAARGSDDLALARAVAGQMIGRALERMRYLV